VDLIRAVMESVQGMKYLHGRDMLYGDLEVTLFPHIPNMSSDHSSEPRFQMSLLILFSSSLAAFSSISDKMR
jgi:hypothetical protein